MNESDQPIVLVVEDEPDIAETYERWLQDYDVRRAETADEALATVDDSVDVVLLDRMLPGRSGSEVLAEIRSRGIDCRVAMVTAVDPGLDVLEMGFDEYLTKPPGRDELRKTVGRLLHRATLDDDLQEYYSLVARRAALESELSENRLEENEEYVDLVDRIETHRASVEAAMGDMSSDTGFVSAVREIVDETEPDEAPDGERSDSEG